MKIEVKDKNVTVVGLARSGIGAANLLTELGADVTVTDIKKEDELKDFIPKLRPSVRLVLGTHHEDIFLSSDMLVISPGVPLTITPISNAKARGIPIIGELELAYQIVSSQQSAVSPPTPTFKSPHPPFTKGGRGGINLFSIFSGLNTKSAPSLFAIFSLLLCLSVTVTVTPFSFKSKRWSSPIEPAPIIKAWSLFLMSRDSMP